MPKFSQKIYRVGMNPCVEVPPRVSADLGKTGYVPVNGTINDQPFRATLVPVGGRHRLYINDKMRRDAGVDVGALIEVALEVDNEPREQPVPEALEAALAGRPRARARYNAFPPSHKKEILTYLNSLKTPEALKQNIDRLLAKLEES